MIRRNSLAVIFCVKCTCAAMLPVAGCEHALPNNCLELYVLPHPHGMWLLNRQYARAHVHLYMAYLLEIPVLPCRHGPWFLIISLFPPTHIYIWPACCNSILCPAHTAWLVKFLSCPNHIRCFLTPSFPHPRIYHICPACMNSLSRLGHIGRSF